MQKHKNRCFAAVAVLALTIVQVAFLPQRRASASDIPDFSFLGAVGTLTEAQTLAAAESIYESLAAHSDYASFELEDGSFPVITPTTENLDSLMAVFTTIIGNWDVGILAKKNSSNCIVEKSDDGGKVKGMAIYYLTDDESYDEVYANVIEQLDCITAGVDPSWSAPEKALYLHEYLALHYDYDREALQGPLSTEEERLCYTAYGMLKNGKAVCEGYTWLYGILLRRVGIESLAVRSVELNHTWNVLNIDGYWYHVDVTWDDDNTHPGLVMHTSFLKDTAAMKASKHSSNDWMLSTGQPVSELKESDKYNNAF